MASKTDQNKYKGLTKRQYKRVHGSSTAGSTKGENCKATGLQKAMIKYPRSVKTDLITFNAVYKLKDKADNKRPACKY